MFGVLIHILKQNLPIHIPVPMIILIFDMQLNGGSHIPENPPNPVGRKKFYCCIKI